jgi:hypothetical protein
MGCNPPNPPWPICHPSPWLEAVKRVEETYCRCIAFSTSSASAHPTPAPAVDAQDGTTLGPESGELGADFCSLGKTPKACPHQPHGFHTCELGLPKKSLPQLSWKEYGNLFLERSGVLL